MRIRRTFYVIIPIAAIVFMLAGQSGASAKHSTQANALIQREFNISPQAGKPVPNQFIVMLKPDAAQAALPDLKKESRLTYDATVIHSYNLTGRGFSLSLSPSKKSDALRSLRMDPRVDYVVPDVWMTANAYKGSTWGLDRVDDRDRIDYNRLTRDNSYSADAFGTTVDVYIMDTGININHIELAERASYGVNTNPRDYPGERRFPDGTLDTTNASDCFGHGTHVAGIAGSNSYGVASNIALKAVRVLDCHGDGSTSGTVSEVKAGVEWVTQQKLDHPGVPMVVNMSLGCGAGVPCDDLPHQPLKDAIAASTLVGVTYVVAVGNDARIVSVPDACKYSIGAGIENVINVSATDNADRVATYANYGSCVDILAPGGDFPPDADTVIYNEWPEPLAILSSWALDKEYRPEYTTDPQYLVSNYALKTMIGTSMAAPVVSGVAALYLQDHPNAQPSEVKDAILTSATQGVVTEFASGIPWNNDPLHSSTTHSFIYSGLTKPAPYPISRPVIQHSDLEMQVSGGVWSSIPESTQTSYQWHNTDQYAGDYYGHPYCPSYPEGSGWMDVGDFSPNTTTATDPDQYCWAVTERKTNQESGDVRYANSTTLQVDYQPPVNTSPPTITRSGNTLMMTGEGGWIVDGPITTTYIWHWSHYTESSNGHGYCTSSYPGSGIWHDIVSTQSSYAMTSTDAGRYCWALSVMKEKAGGGGGDVGTSEVLPVTFNVPTAQSIPTISRLGMTLSMTGASWSQVPDSLVTGYRWKSNNDQTCPVYPNGLWTNAGTATTQMITAAQRCWVVIETKTNPISGESVDATSSVFALPVPVISRSAPNGNWPVLSSDAVTWAGGSLDNVTYKWYLSGYRSGGIEACPVWGEGTWTQTGTAATQTTNDTQHCWVVLLKKTDPATGQYMEVASGVFHLKYLSPTAGPAPTISRSPVNGSSITLSASSGSWTLRDPVKATIVWERSYYSAPGMCSGATTWTTASIANLSYSGSAAISIPQQAAHFSQPCWRVSVLRENAGGGVSMASIYRIPFTAPVALSAPTITKLSSSALRGTPGTSGGDPGTLYYLWQWAPHAGSSYGHGYCPTASASSWQGSWVATWGGIPDQYMAPNQPCWKLTTFRANDAGTSAALSSSVLMAWG